MLPCVKSTALPGASRHPMHTDHTSHTKKNENKTKHTTYRKRKVRGFTRITTFIGHVPYPLKAHITYYDNDNDRSLGVPACKQGAEKQTTNPQQIMAPLHTRERGLSIPSSLLPPLPPSLPSSLPRLSTSIHGAGRASTRQKIKRGRPGLWCSTS